MEQTGRLFYFYGGCRRIDGAHFAHRLFSLPIRLLDEHAAFNECMAWHLSSHLKLK
jgi:hypothetical protein